MRKSRTLRSLRKATALLLTLVFILTLIPFASAADYTGHWAQDSIDKAVQMGWFADANSTRPNAPITRAEFVTMVNRMKGYSGSADLSAFSDISEDEWYYNAFSTAVANGYIQGSGGKLSPNTNITRNEAVTIFARISGLNTSADYSSILENVRDASNIPVWAVPYAGAAVANGLIAGSGGNFNGGANITRAETAVLLQRLYDNVRTYGFAGTYTGSANGVVIAAADIMLRDYEIDGDLTIAEGVGDGEVYLENVNVAGKLDVRGGGRNSVYISGGNISEITVTKDGVHVVMSDGTTVTYVNVNGTAPTIELGNGVTVGNITIEADSNGADIVVGSGATIDNVTVNAANTNVTLDNGASITTMNVAAEATGATITTETGSNIGTVTINAVGTAITGSGAITTVNVKAAQVVIEQKPANTNVDSGLTANVGNQNVEGPPASGSSGGGGGGGGDYSDSGNNNNNNNNNNTGGTTTYSYSIAFNENGGTGSMTPLIGTAASVTLTANMFTRSGYYFTGWKTEPTGGTAYADGATITLSAALDITLYAQWTEIPTISSVPITGDALVGSVLTVGTIVYSAEPPSNPTLTYQWYRNTTPITGAEGSSYTIILADHGQKIKVAVTASGTASGTAESAQTETVENTAATVTSTGAFTVAGNDISAGSTAITFGTTTGNGIIAGLTPALGATIRVYPSGTTVNNKATWDSTSASATTTGTISSGDFLAVLSEDESTVNIYTITQSTALQGRTLTFADTAPSAVTYGDDSNSFTNAATASDGTGTVSYSSSDINVATVAEGGVVTILTAGSTIITATIPSDGTYVTVTQTYTLTIDKADATVTGTGSIAEAVSGESVTGATIAGLTVEGVNGETFTGTWAYTAPSTSGGTATATFTKTGGTAIPGNYNDITEDITFTTIKHQLNTPAADEKNGVTATVTFDTASPVANAANVTATVTLTGDTPAATAIHTVDLTSAKASLISSPKTANVTAGTSLGAGIMKTFTFTMPDVEVDDLTLTHSYAAVQTMSDISIVNTNDSSAATNLVVDTVYALKIVYSSGVSALAVSDTIAVTIPDAGVNFSVGAPVDAAASCTAAAVPAITDTATATAGGAVSLTDNTVYVPIKFTSAHTPTSGDKVTVVSTIAGIAGSPMTDNSKLAAPTAVDIYDFGTNHGTFTIKGTAEAEKDIVYDDSTGTFTVGTGPDKYTTTNTSILSAIANLDVNDTFKTEDSGGKLEEITKAAAAAGTVALVEAECATLTIGGTNSTGKLTLTSSVGLGSITIAIEGGDVDISGITSSGAVTISGGTVTMKRATTLSFIAGGFDDNATIVKDVDSTMTVTLSPDLGALGGGTTTTTATPTFVDNQIYKFGISENHVFTITTTTGDNYVVAVGAGAIDTSGTLLSDRIWTVVGSSGEVSTTAGNIFCDGTDIEAYDTGTVTEDTMSAAHVALVKALVGTGKLAAGDKFTLSGGKVSKIEKLDTTAGDSSVELAADQTDANLELVGNSTKKLTITGTTTANINITTGADGKFDLTGADSIGTLTVAGVTADLAVDDDKAVILANSSSGVVIDTLTFTTSENNATVTRDDTKTYILGVAPVTVAASSGGAASGIIIGSGTYTISTSNSVTFAVDGKISAISGTVTITAGNVDVTAGTLIADAKISTVHYAALADAIGEITAAGGEITLINASINEFDVGSVSGNVTLNLADNHGAIAVTGPTGHGLTITGTAAADSTEISIEGTPNSIIYTGVTQGTVVFSVSSSFTWEGVTATNDTVGVKVTKSGSTETGLTITGNATLSGTLTDGKNLTIASGTISGAVTVGPDSTLNGDFGGANITVKGEGAVTFSNVQTSGAIKVDLEKTEVAHVSVTDPTANDGASSVNATNITAAIAAGVVTLSSPSGSDTATIYAGEAQQLAVATNYVITVVISDGAITSITVDKPD